MPEPYVNTQPGDLITANLFNGLQSTIRQDIADQVKKAIDALKTVDNSGDSAKLGGTDERTKQICTGAGKDKMTAD